MHQIVPIMPRGTNSTIFTECCQCAITSRELCCPSCGEEVVGADASSDWERDYIRWNSATRNWKRAGRYSPQRPEGDV